MNVIPRRTRGRPRSSGELQCDRCGRATGKIRVHWPDGGICGICYHQAARTFGACDQCGEHGLLPGRCDTQRLCISCSGITTALTCTRCGAEGERYRRGICSRCALRDDLNDVFAPHGKPVAANLARLIDALCAVERPESIITWKRNPDVLQLLGDIGAATISLTHTGLDAAKPGKAREHLRHLLMNTAILRARDVDLSYFETWLRERLDSISDSGIRRPLEQFATWHHLERIRRQARDGTDVHGATHTAKQQITEVGRFLAWLASRGRTITDCTQADLEEWLATGPSTRTAISTFIVWAGKNRTSRKLAVPRRTARTSPILGDEDRIRLLRTCLTGTDDTTAYRIAAVLLLLYAQPLSKIVELRTADIINQPDGITLRLGTEATSVPEPFAGMLLEHLRDRPNLQTTNRSQNPWLFPGGRPGAHLAANTVMIRLRSIGIDLRAARNAALRSLTIQTPAPIVASQLGYSTQVTIKHAALAAQPDQKYTGTWSRGSVDPGRYRNS